MTGRRLIQLLLIGGALAIQAAAAADTSGRELIDQVERTLWGRTNHGVSEMTVITPSWKRTLRLHFWMERPERTFIRIDAPAKEAGIGSLRIEDEMWNYLPKIERIIKIPPSMMLQPWMGSDLTNDDLVKESSAVEDYRHTLQGTEAVDGQQVYRVESIPKPDAAVVWGKLIYKIRVDNRLPLRVEYYDERGELIKVLRYEDARKLGGRLIPTRWVVQPKEKPGHRTVFVIKEIDFNTPIADSIFSLRNLQRRR
jgi:outer membrane lipoprotein-sorting protein